MGELTPGTQLSMGSAKRLYVLMAGFYMYMHWAFRTSAVKSRHRIFTFRSSSFPSRRLMFQLCTLKMCVRQSNISSKVPMTRPTASQIIPYMFRAGGLTSDCHWEFTFSVQLQIPMTVAEPLGFELHEKICEAALEK